VPSVEAPSARKTADLEKIGQYFAAYGASYGVKTTAKVNAAPGITVPSGVTLFPLPRDLTTQVQRAGDYEYFVAGNNVVIVDAQTRVINAVFPHNETPSTRAKAAIVTWLRR
jgi:hypothetical protein